MQYARTTPFVRDENLILYSTQSGSVSIKEKKRKTTQAAKTTPHINLLLSVPGLRAVLTNGKEIIKQLSRQRKPLPTSICFLQCQSSVP
jgi:hypothetical protein